LEDVLRDTHEDDIWHGLETAILLIFRGVGQGLEKNVRLKVVQDLVVSEVRVLGKIEDRLLLVELIVFIVVNFYETLSDEIHFLNVGLVTDNSLAWSVNSAVHADNKLIGKTSLAFLEEMVEGSLELLEHSGILDEISLHLGGNLLVELELLDNQVEIIEEGLLNVLSDIVIEGGLNMERLVGFLNLLDPHVERIQLLFNQIIEVIGSIENTVDRTHEEGEERQTHEL